MIVLTISEMWDLYDRMENSKFQKYILEIIDSIEEIYERGYWQGNDLFERMNAGACCVYFIVCRDKMKIGVSDNVPRRLKQLQTASGDKMDIFHVIPYRDRASAYKEEARLHEKYAMHKINGEWFDKQIIISEEFVTNFY